MKSVISASVFLPKLVALCARNRLKVVFLALLVLCASLFASKTWLGVTTDTGGMFSASLPWKQRSTALAHLFPQNDQLIVAVIDATIPEEAEATAAALAASLRNDHADFTSIRQPDAIPYLQQNAFLLVPPADLQDVLDRITDAQPFLGQLVADPSLRGLCAALGLVVQGAQHGVNLGGMTAALGKFHIALAAAASGHPEPLSWQQLLGGKLADEAGKYRFVLAKPVLDYGSLEPGGVATKVVRQAAAALPYVRQGDAHVRLTGQVVLDDEEFATVAEGATIGLAGSFLLVTLWLYLAVRSWRLMVPIVCTLVLGLLLTTGYAATVIGTLNLISVAFAVLFVGIAVDFAIQFAVRFREHMYCHPDVSESLRETGRVSGTQILVAACATAAGFLAFAPTRFLGVAQLGIIAGVGMLIAFICTLTFLPAMLCLCHPKGEPAEIGFAAGDRLDPTVRRLRWPLVVVFVVLAATGGLLARYIGFDGNPLHTKDQRTEAVRTLRDLMAVPITNPYTIQAILPSLAAAEDAAKKYAALPSTQTVLTMNSWVPAQQTEKLAAVGDVAALLAPTLTPPAELPPVTAAALREATAKLATALQAADSILKPGDPLRLIGDDVTRLAGTPDATLLAANDALTRFLPAQLDRLRLALAAKPVTLADVPPELKNDWLLPDGQARVQALPTGAVRDGHTMRSWVKAALKAVPQSSGSAVYILKAADTITAAFQIAAWSAVGAITVILAFALRRVADVVLVLVPLAISALLTALLLRLSGMMLNFANIIALPLLLGVGVSFNIYFVMNWRSGIKRFLGTATARAVLFSALTTSTAFGSLALSRHPGTASMGVLLLMSLGCTVTTTLVFVPALLAIIPGPRSGKEERPGALPLDPAKDKSLEPVC
jgi:hopanoid biosynthesis associated RND transporter like protein HpnN